MSSRSLKQEGPDLTFLTHRLAECPEVFLTEPRLFTGSGNVTGKIHTLAVVSDLVEMLGGNPLPPGSKLIQPSMTAAQAKNLLTLIQICCHLFFDPWFRQQKTVHQHLMRFFTQELPPVADIVSADLFVTDSERREELVRLCLAALGLRPKGETEIQALDRLTTVDSVERKRIMTQSREAKKRAEEIRRAIAKKEAEEAASKMSRE